MTIEVVAGSGGYIAVNDAGLPDWVGIQEGTTGNVYVSGTSEPLALGITGVDDFAEYTVACQAFIEVDIDEPFDALALTFTVNIGHTGRATPLRLAAYDYGGGALAEADWLTNAELVACPVIASTALTPVTSAGDEVTFLLLPDAVGSARRFVVYSPELLDDAAPLGPGTTIVDGPDYGSFPPTLEHTTPPEPAPPTVLITLEPDGTTTPNVDGRATSWLPDGTGMRVRLRFIQDAEGVISYNGLVNRWATYADALAAYPDYNALMTDPALAANPDVDIACVVTGTKLTNGSRSPFNEIDAAEATITIADKVGLFDPRLVDTVLGPGRRVRTGTWVRIEVLPIGAEDWLPMFTGLTTSWGYKVNPHEHARECTLECADFFEGLASAETSDALVSQVAGERFDALAGDWYSALWGPYVWDEGLAVLDARTPDRESVLDLMKATACLDDGRVFVAPDGTLTYQAREWRDARLPQLIIIGEGGNELAAALTLCTYGLIAATHATYDEVAAFYLVYEDMAVCATPAEAAPPAVCATTYEAADVDDDVVNRVTLEYQPPSVAVVGYTSGKRRARPVKETAPAKYSHTDADSVARYGLRTASRSDLTPLVPADLDDLAETLVERWKDGDAAVTTATIDFTAEREAAVHVLPLFPGDAINVVDRAPETTAADYLLTLGEIVGMQWNMTPETFDVELAINTLKQ